MLRFDGLSALKKHVVYLAPKLETISLFLVGGCIRDILLGITKDPRDIDLTLAGHPDNIWDDMDIDEAHISRFRTEKYGTMTLLPKMGTYEGVGYEITPFRTEGVYTDVRHPDDIQRSNELLEDSKRRDFTINCVYYTCISTSEHEHVAAVQESKKKYHVEQRKTGTLSKNILASGKNIYLEDGDTLILQQHETIEHAIDQGRIDIGYLLQGLSSVYKSIPQPEELHILIDPHAGLTDMYKRKIVTVGNPDDRFTEDALRILRGLRFPNILNQKLPDATKQNNSFDIEKATRASMKKNAHLVSHLAKERIHEELVKIFSGTNPFGYICLLDELGCIEKLFPALAACKGNEQPTRYHPFDTYTHTLLTLQALQSDAHTPINYLAKCAMLYHDVGKPDQYAYVAEQKMLHGDAPIDMSGYLHHTETGAEIAKKEFSALGFSNKESEEIARYIRRHHRPGEILNSNEKNRIKKIRQLLSEGGLERTINLLAIAIADRNGQFNPLQPAAIEELVDMKHMVQELHAHEGRFTMKELAINGSDIIATYAIPAGPEIGHILQKCFDRVLGDVEARNTKQKLLMHVKTLL